MSTSFSGFDGSHMKHTDGSIERVRGDGPDRYNKIVKLEDYLDKYNSHEIPANDFISTIRSLKYINKHWDKLPNHTKSELLDLFSNSNSELGKDIKMLSRSDVYSNSLIGIEPFNGLNVSRQTKNFLWLLTGIILGIIIYHILINNGILLYKCI